MKLDADGNVHLTYCTNIHAGETWTEVRASLEEYLPRVKAALVPDDSFGIGLRLSAVAANELANETALSEFKTFLTQQNLYVFTLNGFPYGDFHGTPLRKMFTCRTGGSMPDWSTAINWPISWRQFCLMGWTAALVPSPAPSNH